MIIITVFSEIMLHSSLTVSTFRPLKDNSGCIFIQKINSYKWQSSKCSSLNQLLILQLSTDCKKLLIHFPDALFINIG